MMRSNVSLTPARATRAGVLLFMSSFSRSIFLAEHVRGGRFCWEFSEVPAAWCLTESGRWHREHRRTPAAGAGGPPVPAKPSDTLPSVQPDNRKALAPYAPAAFRESRDETRALIFLATDDRSVVLLT